MTGEFAIVMQGAPDELGAVQERLAAHGVDARVVAPPTAAGG